MTNEINPMKEDTAFDKVMGIFKKSDKDNAKNNGNDVIPSSCVCHYLGSNRAIDIISEACACCWDKKIPDEYVDRCEYVAKRTRTGHTSILEHSNFVTYLRVTGSIHIQDLFKFMTWNNYLVITPYIAAPNDFRLVMSGSLRGYNSLFVEADDLNNSILKSVLSVLYLYAPGAAFEDLAKQGLVDIDRFAKYTHYPEGTQMDLTTYYRTEVNEHFDIIGLDSIEKLVANLNMYDPEMTKAIGTRDLIKHVSVTILFKNMSRIITQQLTRHRNGITQESQRYVDYSKASFNSPALFKENIDPKHKYSIRFGPSAVLNMDLQEIGDAMVGVYDMLHNPAICGFNYALVPEDARAYLPGNTRCRKIYMTFRMSNLFKFLLLREAKGAQAEIRLYATEIGEWLRSHTVFISKELTDLYTKPKLLVEDPFRFDLDEGTTEEVIEMTEEDYIRMTGLDQEVAAEEAAANNTEA